MDSNILNTVKYKMHKYIAKICYLFIVYLLSCYSLAFANEKVRPVAIAGCNSVVYSQLNPENRIFIGRMNYPKPGTCLEKKWKLSLFKFDYLNNAMHYIDDVIVPPFSLDDGIGIIESAYDPDIYFNGKDGFIIFECTGKKIPGTSVCGGPFDYIEGKIKLIYVTLIVKGEEKRDGLQYAAADPKVLFFNSTYYVFWSAITKIDGAWKQIDSKVATVSNSDVQNRKITPLTSADVEKFPVFIRNLDISSAKIIGSHIYLIGSSTSENCLTPDGSGKNCFSTVIARSKIPPDVKSIEFIPNLAPLLLAGPQEYARFYELDGHIGIIGHFLKPEIYGKKIGTQGVYAQPVDAAALFE